MLYVYWYVHMALSVCKLSITTATELYNQMVPRNSYHRLAWFIYRHVKICQRWSPVSAAQRDSPYYLITISAFFTVIVVLQVSLWSRERLICTILVIAIRLNVVSVAILCFSRRLVRRLAVFNSVRCDSPDLFSSVCSVNAQWWRWWCCNQG